jgi:hypothetical protein
MVFQPHHISNTDQRTVLLINSIQTHFISNAEPSGKASIRHDADCFDCLFFFRSETERFSVSIGYITPLIDLPATAIGYLHIPDCYSYAIEHWP